MTEIRHTPNAVFELNGGVSRRYAFPNGYGASVIQKRYSYGNEDGLFELAVLDGNGRLTYSTPITDDVIGHLTENEVQGWLDRIAELAPNREVGHD